MQYFFKKLFLDFYNIPLYLIYFVLIYVIIQTKTLAFLKFMNSSIMYIHFFDATKNYIDIIIFPKIQSLSVLGIS